MSHSMSSGLSSSGSGSSRGNSPREREFSARAGTGSRTAAELGEESANLRRSVYKNLCLGAEFNCSMSLIRKYLCLFVFLDLLLHFLVYIKYLKQNVFEGWPLTTSEDFCGVFCFCWTIATNLSFVLQQEKSNEAKHVQDYSLVDVIGHQIKNYDVATSFVDIFFLAVGRFLALEYFYGVARSHSWTGTTMTTALTSVFVIAKSLHYDWENECRRMWLASLIALSLFSAWSEAFLVDFRMIEMENLAGKYVNGKPEAFKRHIPRIGILRAFVPMTATLFKSPFNRPHSLHDIFSIKN